jgi:hypothetical protein
MKMKYLTTKKQMRPYTRWGFGYCSIQTLLRYQPPTAYSAGVYGWSCDYYEIDGTTISIGYDPIGKTPDYKIVRKYEKKAEALLSNGKTYEANKKTTNALLSKMIKELKDNER